LNALKAWGFAFFSLAVLFAASLNLFYPNVAPASALALFTHFFFFISLVLAARFGRLNVLYAIFPAWTIGSLLTSNLMPESFDSSAMDALWLSAWYIAPLNFAVFAWLEERSLFSLGSLLRMLLVFSELSIVLFIATGPIALDAAIALSIEFFQPPQFLVGVPQIAIGFVLAAFVALALKIYAEKQKTLEIAAFFALLGSLLALYFYHERGASIAFLLASASIVSAGFMHLAFRLAYYDELTGVLGRRALFEETPKLSGRYTIAMADIDYFKKFNDDYGHAVGDQALRMVASKLEEVRGGTVYRYGGEEFCFIFRGKTKSEVEPLLEAVRKKIEESPFIKRSSRRPKTKLENFNKLRKPDDKRPYVSITISIGAADSESGAAQNAVLKAADKALYRAKEQGRNRVVV
jgi:diguanylate cyclase (GGDEF)-like protein